VGDPVGAALPVVCRCSVRLSRPDHAAAGSAFRTGCAGQGSGDDRGAADRLVVPLVAADSGVEVGGCDQVVAAVDHRCHVGVGRWSG